MVTAETLGGPDAGRRQRSLARTLSRHQRCQDGLRLMRARNSLLGLRGASSIATNFA